ncbi:type IV pilus assembly protein PilZ [Leptospira yanagawae serovar Saopaulo str. Sao Paulo = ATCC 700523]|uniref:PilZ domain-containing protein n=2 Tax=Leptospira yanagawae TaxID=293069 RepID=A0ABY2M7J7_9LEPT|nr:PilZ domain-containing protein [Leptospira yanagawae]EOQ89927.1 type IV pilus assembly protein PilZ [Leptospira yanagawae serovar Saopaulo str. Sao Paulo = ATCC 700523]TGL24103.1 PilZ domain-containing protein [Leptospira yanagawae]
MADSKQSIFSDSYSKYGGAKQKRKDARVKLDVPCTVELVKSKTGPVTGHLSDLGTGGLAFQTTAIFYEGDHVRIQFSLNQNPLEILGTVHRSSGKTTSVIFKPLAATEHKVVQEFIHKHYFDPKVKK